MRKTHHRHQIIISNTMTYRMKATCYTGRVTSGRIHNAQQPSRQRAVGASKSRVDYTSADCRPSASAGANLRLGRRAARAEGRRRRGPPPRAHHVA